MLPLLPSNTAVSAQVATISATATVATEGATTFFGQTSAGAQATVVAQGWTLTQAAAQASVSVASTQIQPGVATISPLATVTTQSSQVQPGSAQVAALAHIGEQFFGGTGIALSASVATSGALLVGAGNELSGGTVVAPVASVLATGFADTLGGTSITVVAEIGEPDLAPWGLIWLSGPSGAYVISGTQTQMATPAVTSGAVAVATFGLSSLITAQAGVSAHGVQTQVGSAQVAPTAAVTTGGAVQLAGQMTTGGLAAATTTGTADVPGAAQSSPQATVGTVAGVQTQVGAATLAPQIIISTIGALALGGSSSNIQATAGTAAGGTTNGIYGGATVAPQATVGTTGVWAIPGAMAATLSAGVIAYGQPRVPVGTAASGIRVRSDLFGGRPLGQKPGDIRSLSPAQHSTLRTYPIAVATTRLLWRVTGHGQELSPSGARLVARVLWAAAQALERIRQQTAQTPIDAQLLLARVAIAARETSRDLRLLAPTLAGTVDARLSQNALDLLGHIEAADPSLAPLDSTNPAMSRLGTSATLIVDDLRFVRGVAGVAA